MPDLARQQAELRPDSLALMEADSVIDWKSYVDRRDRIANALKQRGAGPGDHVILYCRNSIAFVLAMNAIAHIGAVAIPLNHRIVPDEAAYLIDQSDAPILFVDDDFLPIIEAVRADMTKVRHWVLTGQEQRDWGTPMAALLAAPPDAADPVEEAGGTMIYTGGTTGRPKGAVRTRASAEQIYRLAQELDLASPDNTHLVAGPLYHAGPLAFAGVTSAFGGPLVLMRKFDAEQAWALIEKWRVRSTFMAPTLLKRFLDVPDRVRARHDVSSLQSVLVSGAPCPQSVKERALDLLGPIVYEFYGASETALCTLMRPEDIRSHPGSCGRPPEGVRLKIADEAGEALPVGEVGELYVHVSAGVFDGYYRDEAASAETRRGEWVSVGDIARMDEDGFVYICDRKRDMIISGGVNIYSAEIENVLHQHPAIADIAVFGVPDPEWGERIHAAIELKPGQQAEGEEIRGWARGRMADYKIPREISFHAALPRDQAGKLRKRALRDPFWQDQEQAG